MIFIKNLNQYKNINKSYLLVNIQFIFIKFYYIISITLYRLDILHQNNHFKTNCVKEIFKVNKKGIILDLEGTLLSNGAAIDGSIEFLNYLISNNFPFKIITNTVSKTPLDLSNIFSNLGVAVPKENFINPLKVLNKFLIEQTTESFYFIGSDQLLNSLDFKPSFVDVPDYVVLCDFEYIDCSYQLLNKIFTFLNNGSQLITMSNSQYYLSKNGSQLDTGAFTKMFEIVTGKEAILFGKPSPIIYAEAAKETGLKCSELIAIGDDVLTDIVGANEFGAYSILVKSGKYKCGDEEIHKPNKVAENLLEIIPLLTT